MRDIINKVALVENKQQYFQMLQPLENIKSKMLEINDKNFDNWVDDLLYHRDDAEYIISKYMQDLKRKDRIVWALRWFRVFHSDYLFENVNSYLNQIIKDNKVREFPEELENINKQLSLLNKKYYQDMQQRYQISIDAIYNEAKDFASNFYPQAQFYQHLTQGNPSMLERIPQLNDLVWDRQLPVQLMNQLDKLEREWAEKRKSLIVPSPEDKILIDYGNSAWFLLPREYCDTEAEAMGHCGNTGNPQSGDRILSYRDKRDDGWFPHLTFIIDEDGYLGEMKGRGNAKPISKYHSVIIDLLKHEIVQGIKGGGYIPENNFKLTDLTEEQRIELAKEKPQIADFESVKKVYGLESNEILLSLKNEYKMMGFNPQILDLPLKGSTDLFNMRPKKFEKSFCYDTFLNIGYTSQPRQTLSLREWEVDPLLYSIKLIFHYNKKIIDIIEILDKADQEEFSDPNFDYDEVLEYILEPNEWNQIDEFLKEKYGDDYRQHQIIETDEEELADAIYSAVQVGINRYLYKKVREDLIDSLTSADFINAEPSGVTIRINLYYKDNNFYIVSSIIDAIAYIESLENHENEHVYDSFLDSFINTWEYKLPSIDDDYEIDIKEARKTFKEAIMDTEYEEILNNKYKLKS